MANKQYISLGTGRNRGNRTRGQARGRGGQAAGRDRSQSAVSSGPPEPPQRLIVKLKLNYGALTEQLRTSLLQPDINALASGAQEVDKKEDELPVEDDELPIQPFFAGHLPAPFVAETPEQRTRTGRKIKAPKQHDTVAFHSDMLEPSSVGKVDEDQDEEDYQEHKSSTPHSLTIHQSKPKLGRPRKSTDTRDAQQPAATHVQRQDSSSTVPPSSPPGPISVPAVDPRCREIFRYLCAQSTPATSLPELETPGNPNVEEPYSAKFLTELYMIAHASGHWDTCDLVVDTWIRMFQRLRRRSEREGESTEARLWRFNRALYELRKNGKRGYDAPAPTYGDKLPVEDPSLHADAHVFDRALLSRLYTHTPANCGARLVWADSMAISGTKVEQLFQRAKKDGEPWHPDLMHDVMCAALRVVRRKLTLKIEEATEGAWCRRYHEHAKRGFKCYREVAARQVDGEEGAGQAKKRGRQAGGQGEDGDGRAAKRARFEMEVVDVDAEGESK